jgi:hypothetical protein
MGPLESSNGTGTYFNDAIKFWEPRRITYNLVLIAVTAVWFTLDWSHFRLGLNLQLLLALSALAALANICYCAAYLVDIPLQYSSFRTAWRRRRWWLWVAGVLLAALLASYWINDEIYPGIGTTNLSPRARITNS